MSNILDPTESTRRAMVAQLAADPGPRERLEAEHGQVWNTDQLCAEFTVLGFLAPYVVVVRKVDGVKGSLMFQHSPRLYWGFQAD